MINLRTLCHFLFKGKKHFSVPEKKLTSKSMEQGSINWTVRLKYNATIEDIHMAHMNDQKFSKKNNNNNSLCISNDFR